ncbi:uncharacterized protein LOC116418473 [Piliocolobus tephrosceles]|uniref:uncharacterized protein LOC116418473 n=1 Tax=Piliocolobus tephrosceles TaxID=591936 RepID=UPI0013010601|nr:uncharacterized protein LOC116418473 [Piliocolobus tephrosceles]
MLLSSYTQTGPQPDLAPAHIPGERTNAAFSEPQAGVGSIRPPEREVLATHWLRRPSMLWRAEPPATQRNLRPGLTGCPKHSAVFECKYYAVLRPHHQQLKFSHQNCARTAACILLFLPPPPTAANEQDRNPHPSRARRAPPHLPRARGSRRPPRAVPTSLSRPDSRRRPLPAGAGRSGRLNPGQRLTRKLGVFRSPAREGPWAGGWLGAAPSESALDRGLRLQGPEPIGHLPPRRPGGRCRRGAPTLRTARRVRSANLAAAHPPATPAPPSAAAAVRSVNIPASPRRGAGRAPAPPRAVGPGRLPDGGFPPASPALLEVGKPRRFPYWSRGPSLPVVRPSVVRGTASGPLRPLPRLQANCPPNPGSAAF